MKLPTHLGSLPSETPSEMVKHLYSDDDRDKKSKITAVPSAFPLEAL